MSFFLRGFLIGLLFGIPVGAVGAMTVQRTLEYGPCAGLLTGLGSSLADCVYACIGAFGLTTVSDILLRYQIIIRCCGGVVIVLMGLALLFSRPSDKAKTEPFAYDRAGWVTSAFFVGITNPAAILTFLFAFSYFGISELSGMIRPAALVCGVFAGTYLWWSVLSFGTDVLHHRFRTFDFSILNKTFSVLLLLLGAVVLLQCF